MDIDYGPVKFDWCDEHQCMCDCLCENSDGKEYYDCPICYREWKDEMFGDVYGDQRI